MGKFLILLMWMIFCHIIDDFVLQAACLSSLKQKSFWEENAPDDKYRYDYIVAILVHGFSWSFMIHLPILIKFYSTMNLVCFCMSLLAEASIHAYIDNHKANHKEINLIIDQSLHLLQILFTLLMSGVYI